MAENVTRIRDYSSDVKQRIAALETQMNIVARDVEKIESKIDQQYEQLHSRISDMKDEIRHEIDDKHEKLIQKLDAHSKTEALNNDTMEKKISGLEKWRWFLMGGAAVVGYILAHVKIEKLF